MRIHWQNWVRSACAVLRDLGRLLKISRELRVAILVILLATLSAVLLLEWSRGDLSGVSVLTLWKQVFE